MAVKLKTPTQTSTPANGIKLPALAPKAPKAASWTFDVLASDGSAALVMAHPPKGSEFVAMATLKADGTVQRMGLKVTDAGLASAFARLLSLVQ